jgi:hypothetical protein
MDAAAGATVAALFAASCCPVSAAYTVARSRRAVPPPSLRPAPPRSAARQVAWTPAAVAAALARHLPKSRHLAWQLGHWAAELEQQQGADAAPVLQEAAAALRLPDAFPLTAQHLLSFGRLLQEQEAANSATSAFLGLLSFANLLWAVATLGVRPPSYPPLPRPNPHQAAPARQLHAATGLAGPGAERLALALGRARALWPLTAVTAAAQVCITIGPAAHVLFAPLVRLLLRHLAALWAAVAGAVVAAAKAALPLYAWGGFYACLSLLASSSRRALGHGRAGAGRLHAAPPWQPSRLPEPAPAPLPPRAQLLARRAPLGGADCPRPGRAAGAVLPAVQGRPGHGVRPAGARRQAAGCGRAPARPAPQARRSAGGPGAAAALAAAQLVLLRLDGAHGRAAALAAAGVLLCCGALCGAGLRGWAASFPQGARVPLQTGAAAAAASRLPAPAWQQGGSTGGPAPRARPPPQPSAPSAPLPHTQ